MGEGAAICVEVTGESTILQESPAEPYSHFLSNLDLTFDNNLFYAQIVFLFRGAIDSQSPQDVESTMDGLKRSACKLLDTFPLLAGRLRKNEEQHNNRTEIFVNNRGFPFYEARCDARLSDWEELRHCDIDLKLNPSNEGIKNILEAPLIRLQATVFKDGGLAIGFSAMHIVVDGANLIDIFKAWGEIHRGLPVSKPPAFCTDLLKARDPPRITHPLPDNLSFFDHDMDLDFMAMAAGKNKIHNKKQLSRHIFKMESQAVDDLVREIEQGPHKYGRVSSYEAISAFFWRCISKARADSGCDSKGVSHFTIPVSVTRKGRFEPDLPEGYFGNAVVMTLATSTIGEITGDHISLAAKLIHKRAQSYVPELAKSVIDQLQIRLREGKSLGISIGEGPPSGRDVLSTSLASFPVYQIEFQWGKLDQCIFSFPLEIGEGLISTLPVPEGGRGRHIAVCLREDHMQKLIDDPFFSKYCKF